ncbi:PHB depolymerase family esterase [Roseateles sp. SL47]|uniref:extracellular catalytic domain type 1 short-chain-length polyhydroxyalkanoate depolymerase n=1 Tax=Roseateles sp. SL47 TaxID=2995138 RepID=UPI00226D415F|nr:PHB depolymerase family esterase [Roseateles sp. SL47]WAC71016.1 PHB depolymerase family esterase [Roseateles sp. SL47]
MINPDFQRMMARAALQTRRADLAGATRTIQQALSGVTHAAADDQDGDVIDVEARVINDTQEGIETTVKTRPGEAPRPGPAADVREDAREDTREGRFLAATFTRASISINYKLYVPPGDAAEPRPLLLMLHGCKQDPDDFAAGTRMNEVARRHGWLVLYPEQSAAMNPQCCWSWFKSSHQQRGRGEPALLAALTRHVMETHAVDARQVHVAGLSAGGAMATVMGQVYPELFAAVGVHSGLPFAVAANATEALARMRSGPGAREIHPGVKPVRAVPTIVFHGTRDMTVHPLNGERVYVDAVAGVAGSERIENGREGGRPYTRRSYFDANGQSQAELWLVEGAGHAWSGGDQAGSHADWQGPDAAGQMICFFSAHPLAADRPVDRSPA